MKTEILFVNSSNEDKTYSDFVDQLMEHPTIQEDFNITRMNEVNIRDKIKEYITKKGISSLYNYHMTCDAVLHGGISIDEIEELVLGFIRKLKGVKNLLITDQFLYTNDIACVNLFERIILEISENIETVTFVTNKDKLKDNAEIHKVLKKISPNIKIIEKVSNQIHDRFWIDIDNYKGVVMGTSLNGIGKKLALIDHLKSIDVQQIIKLADTIK